MKEHGDASTPLDAIVALGGGSVMDTAKAMNLLLLSAQELL